MKRLRVALLSPVEVVLCIAYGAWTGAVDGLRNVREAWNNAIEKTESGA